MPPRARAVDRLRHVLAATARIEARTAGRTFEDYAAAKTRAACANLE